MQDEVNEKTVSLCIRCGKVTANLLKAAMKKALTKMEQEKQKLQGQKQPKQDKEDKTYKGKQSMDKLMKQNVQLSNIEITDGNIKSFERVAKKYSIDFSLKKDVNADPPRYYVFFKARDADVMTAAFKEYTGQSLNKDKKPSVRKKLQQAISKSLKKHRELEKTKGKEKEPDSPGYFPPSGAGTTRQKGTGRRWTEYPATASRYTGPVPAGPGSAWARPSRPPARHTGYTR